MPEPEKPSFLGVTEHGDGDEGLKINTTTVSGAKSYDGWLMGDIWRKKKVFV
jgi:hypothetical protein